MLGLVAKYLQDASVLRRLLFAAVFLSPELPAFWEVVLEFATKGKLSKYSVTSEQIRALTENLQALNESAFTTDCKLQQELLSLHLPGKKPLGVILISPISSCLLCGCELQLRKDRHAPVVLYDINLGTIPGAHFHKFCTNRTCSLTQYYGYYRTQGKAIFNQDWAALPYFLSSSETGFSLELLWQLDANILIGQMSFKQQADIYNYVHKYSLETAEPSRYVCISIRM